MRRALWWIALACLLFASGCCGCARDLQDFAVASSGLSRPTRNLTCESKDRVIDRIRWFEQVQRWERQLQPHALSKFLPEVSKASLYTCDQTCESTTNSCCDCYKVEFCGGYIDLACYSKTNATDTTGQLSGLLLADVATMEQTEGEAYYTWQRVCYPATKKDDPKVQGICADGLVGYRVQIDNARSPNRFDVVFNVRLWIQEGGDVKSLRLDASYGAVFLDRANPEVTGTLRRAIFFEDSSLVYSGFKLSPAPTTGQPDLNSTLQSSGEVKILGSTGEYRCCFKVDATTGARTSTCLRISDNQPLCANSTNICP